MTQQILDYKDINPEAIIFEPPKKVKGGSYMTEIKYRTPEGDDVPFIIQTPRLISSEGIVRNETRAHVELEFDKNHWPFYEFITNIDDHNIVIIEKHSEQWFTSKFPIDVVEEFYKTPVKLGRGKNPPKLKIKIPINRGELSCNIFDNVKNSINYTEVKKNNKVVCVMQLVGLRFLKQQVICEWVPLQIKVCKESVKQKMDYMINDTLLSDYEDNDTESLEQKISNPVLTEEPQNAPVTQEALLTTEEVPVSQETSPTTEEAPVSQEAPSTTEEVPPQTEEVPVSQEVVNTDAHPVELLTTGFSNEQEGTNDLIPNFELDTDELQSIDLSNLDGSEEEQVEPEDPMESLESRIESLNLELSQKNNIIEQMKSLLMN